MEGSKKMKSQNEKGSAILQALVYTALLAAVLVTAVTFYTNQIKVSKSQLKFSTRDELRNSVSAYIQIPEALNKSLISASCATAIQGAQSSGTQLNNNFLQCLPHLAMGIPAYSASSDPLHPQDAGYVPFELISPFPNAGGGNNVVAGTKAAPVYYDELGNRCANSNCPFQAYTMYRLLPTGVNGEPSVEIKFRLEPTNYDSETTIKAKSYEATNQMSIFQINRRGDPAKVTLCVDDAGVVLPGMIRVGLQGNTAEPDVETEICVPAIGTQVCAPNEFQTGIRSDGSPICGGLKGTCPDGHVIIGMKNGAGAVEPACMDSRCNNKLDAGIYRFGYVSPGNLSTEANGVECVLIRPSPPCVLPGFITIKKGLTNIGELSCDPALPPPPSCPVPLPAPQTIVSACPPPQFGSITQTRSFVCPPAPGAWGAWTTTSSTCVAGPTCGIANGVTTTTAPTGGDLCASGVASIVTDTGIQFTWTCDNAPAPSANCVAPKAAGPTPVPTTTATPTPVVCDTTTEYATQALCETAKGVGNCTSVTAPSGPLTCQGGFVCNSVISIVTNPSDCNVKSTGDACSFSQACANTGTWQVGVEPQKCELLFESVCPWLPGPQPGSCLATDPDCKMLAVSPMAAVSCAVRRCNATGTTPVGVLGTCVGTSITVWKEDCSGPTPTPVPTAAPTAAPTATATPVPVPGVCGTANGVAIATAPTTNLCGDGATPVLSGTGPWSWTCPGSYGGPSSGVCIAPVLTSACNLTCTSGTPTCDWLYTIIRVYSMPYSCIGGAFKNPGSSVAPPAGLTNTGVPCESYNATTMNSGQVCYGTEDIGDFTAVHCGRQNWKACVPTGTPTPAPTPVCGTYMPTSSTMAGNFGVYTGTFNELNHRCTNPGPSAKTARIGGVAADGSQYYCVSGGYACLPGYNATTPSASVPVPGTWQITVNNISSYNAGFYYPDCSSEPTVGQACTVSVNTSQYQGINEGSPVGNSFFYCNPNDDYLKIWSCVPN